MPKAIGDEIEKRILQATEDLAVAHREVEHAMEALTGDRPRAEKTIITDALRVAFEKLAAARQTLEALTADGTGGF